MDPVPVQTALLAPLTPDEIITHAVAEHQPKASIALFSGGNDSSVLAHRCREHYSELAFIDTGTAIPGVREFAGQFAEWLGKPLRILESGNAYRKLILGGQQVEGGKEIPALGFPGPAQHGRAYTILKERRLEELRRMLKISVRDRIMFLSGVRRDESARRRNRPAVKHWGSVFFVQPLNEWTGAMMREYRQQHKLPQSDVAALIHRSGECNCGAFAAPGEREELEALWPDWFDQTIASLEREAEAAGIRACRWGSRPSELPADMEAGPMCSDCQLRIEHAVAD